MNQQPSTSNSQPSTLNPQPQTNNTQPSTFNPQLKTPNPQILNPKPLNSQLLNPKPLTLNLKPQVRLPLVDLRLDSLLLSLDGLDGAAPRGQARFISSDFTNGTPTPSRCTPTP